MALILCIETATPVCSASLSDNGKLLALEETEGNNLHAEKLALLIGNILEKASRSPADLDAIAVGKGPGSYTGLRIGTSIAKGLCFGLEIPLIAIPTLQAMALSAIIELKNADILYCPMIDARRQEVYTAIFDNKGNEMLPVCAKILDADSFAGLLDKHSIAFFGTGMEKMKLLSNTNDIRKIWLEDIYSSAKNMVSLAEDYFASGNFVTLANYEPYYLKDFVSKKKAV
jgi:tRNA threonylcarbamoyladenosine biosynthesis protein TsaB